MAPSFKDPVRQARFRTYKENGGRLSAHEWHEQYWKTGKHTARGIRLPSDRSVTPRIRVGRQPDMRYRGNRRIIVRPQGAREERYQSA